LTADFADGADGCGGIYFNDQRYQRNRRLKIVWKRDAFLKLSAVKNSF
jgi:hypothetical protein